MNTIERHAVEAILSKYRDQPRRIHRLLEKTYLTKDKIGAVLGVDIYKYSEFSDTKQLLIPLIFHKILHKTLEDCLKHSRFFFLNVDQGIFLEKYFIDMGDGGFILFDNPLQALFFSFFFESNLRIFNSRVYLPDYANFVGKIELRYALTFDALYQMGQNHYGASIINNARILSKDKLNRFLIDQNTQDWFLRHYGGIESLRILDLDDYMASEPFTGYTKPESNDEPFFMYHKEQRTNMIDTIQIMKIGQISSKAQKLDIYNLFVQLTMVRRSMRTQKITAISIGNHNVSGIDQP